MTSAALPKLDFTTTWLDYYGDPFDTELVRAESMSAALKIAARRLARGAGLAANAYGFHVELAYPPC